MSLRAHARDVRARFIDRRTPRRALPLTIARRRLYILPTRSGSLFALLLMVMLLGATNYSNSLAFALTFWLAAIALVSMHHAHANLVGLQIVAVQAAPVFAGTPARFEITLSHDTNRSRRAVRLRAEGIDTSDRVDIAPGETRRVVLSCDAPVRGRLRCPRLRVESAFPVGMFRAWSWLQPDTQTLIYPKLAGSERLPVRRGGDQATRHLRHRGDDEFLGHRPYLSGDSPRRVDWKATARSDDLLVREYAEHASETLWLDENAAPGAGREDRLSQLARWVVLADRAGVTYGLHAGDTRLGPAQGPAHRQACLRALALA